MKRLAVGIIAFAFLGGVLQAQEIAGTWQGTLSPPAGGNPLRVVLQITRGDNQALKGQFFSIDQNPRPIDGSVTFQGSVLKVTVPTIGGSYEGRLSADGSTINGTFTQGRPATLNLTRATPATAWAIPEPPPVVKSMAADTPEAKLVFEVATIKPANPENQGKSILVGRNGSNLLTTTNSTLRDLIALSYGIHANQLVGAPAWVESDQFDVTAKPEEQGIPNERQLQIMIRRLLKERWGLELHLEKREMSAYVLTVGKGGPKLTKNESGGNLPGFGGRGPGAIGVNNSTMTEFARFLQARILDRPVVDQTGLTDKFNFQLQWRPDPAQAGAAGQAPQLPPEVESRPDMFTAIQEQLGLKLENMKAPVDVYVVDKVQKPSEN